MFLAFKKYGVNDPYGDQGTDPAPWEIPLDPIEKTVARCVKPVEVIKRPTVFIWLYAALLWVTDVQAFEELFIKEVQINWAMRTVDEYDRHLKYLVSPDCGLLEPARSGTLKFVSRYFAVAKKGGKSSRSIVNLRSLSKHMRAPPTVNLPEIPEVLTEAAQLHTYWQSKKNAVTAPSVYVADIRHYFHNIECHDKIGAYFGIACAGKYYTWRGLPMGWSYSPRIAQCFSWNLILDCNLECLQSERQKAAASSNPPSFVFTRNKRGERTGLIFIWYDNIVYLEYENDHVAAVVGSINDNRRRDHMQWSSDRLFSPTELKAAPRERETRDGEPNVHPAFLGVSLRVQVERRPRSGEPRSRLVWQCEEKLREKARVTAEALQNDSGVSRRSVARGVGLVVWKTYVCARPLIEEAATIAIARTNAPNRPGKKQWDQPSNISVAERAALVQTLLTLSTDLSWYPTSYTTTDAADAMRVVSDASGKMGAWITLNGDGSVGQTRAWSWDSKMEKSSIFLKELSAAVQAIEVLSAMPHTGPPRSFHLAVDNSAAMFVIKRGLSTNPAANELLVRLYAACPAPRIRVTLVRSEDNAADPLTRRRPLCLKRNAASMDRLDEAREGWPRTQNPSKRFRSNSDSDSEEESAAVILRHSEADEEAGICGICGEDEYESDD